MGSAPPPPDAGELGRLSPVEARLLAAPGDLAPAERIRILGVVRAIEAGELRGLFQLPARPSQRELKRAYFELSKLYHPDRFYRREVGEFGPLLERIFATLSQYVKTLGDSRTVVGQARGPAPRRRRHERLTFATPVDLRFGSRGVVESLETFDVSSGGVFVPTAHPAPVGDAVDLRIALPGTAPVVLHGRVVHSRTVAGEGRPAGAGIEIAATSDGAVALMLRLVNRARRAAPVAAPTDEPRTRVARGSQGPTPAAPVIAIDLGTSYTSVAAAIGSRVVVLPWPDGRLAIPSMVASPRRGEWLIGEPARARLDRDPVHVVASVKRLLGRTLDDPEIRGHLAQAAYPTAPGPDGFLTVTMWGETYAVPQLVALLLDGARKAAAAALGAEVRRAVVSVPVSFTDERVALLRRAGRLVGLDVLEVIEEPSAAALACRHADGFGGTIGVYDFGGGTFDFSLVDVSGGDFRVLTTAGDSWLGGDDLDQAIADAVADQFWLAHKIDLRHRAVEWQHLLSGVERAKRDLTRADHARLIVPAVMHTAHGPRDLRVTLRREVVEPLWRPAIDRSIDTCVQALSLVGRRADQLSAVYLSGGTSYVPAVRRAIADRFKVPVKVGAPPDHAVCLGAGIHAAQLTRRLQTSLPARA